MQDPKGILYFAHDEGVLSYNGVEWNVISIKGGITAHSLAVDSSGNIFVGSDNEFGKLVPNNHGQLRYTSLSDTFQNLNSRLGIVHNTLALNNAVYFVTANRLIKLSDGSLSIVENDISIIEGQAFAVEGALFLNIKNKGLCKREDDFWVPVSAARSLINESVTGIVKLDKGEQYLVGYKFHGLVSIRNGQAFRFLTAIDNYLRNNVISTMHSLPYNHIGIGTYRGGIVVIDKKGEPKYIENKLSGMPDNAVSSIAVDHQQGVWVTTDNGLARLGLYSPVFIYGEGSDLRGNVLLMSRFNGYLYVVTRQGIFFLQECDSSDFKKSYFRFHDNFGEIKGFFTEFKDLLTVENSFLIATTDGIYEMENMSPRKLVPDNTFDLYLNNNNANIVYAATDQGLRILERINGRWTSIYGGFGLPFPINDIIQKENNLWLSSHTNGVMKVTLAGTGNAVESLEFYGFKSFPGNSPIGLQMLDGHLLFTSKRGIFRYSESNNNFVKDTSLFVPEFYNTTKHIKEIKPIFPGNWMVFTDEATSPVTMTSSGRYSWEPGKLGVFADPSYETAFADESGIVWLGGSKGLLRIDPAIAQAISDTLQIHITSVTLNDREVLYGLYDSIPQDLVLPYGVNRLAFKFAVNNFADPETSRFQHKLDGFDKNWSEWSSQASEEYTNLSEGKYTFYVRTENFNDQLITAKPITFTIRAPWYRTWWSYLLWVALLVVIVYVVITLRSRQLKNEKEKLETEVAERTKELKQSQDRLVEQQKLASLGQLTAGIAHEIKNPLNFVNNFAELSEELVEELNEELEKHTDKLEADDQEYIEEILNDLKHNVQKINEHGKRADNIMRGMLMHSRAKSDEKEPVKLNEMLDENIKLAYHGFRSKNSGTQVQIKKEFDERINEVYLIRQDVARVILNIVNNAIYATVKRRDTETESFVPTVNVTSKLLDNNKIEIRIKDNGTGISKDNLQKIFNPFFTTKPTGEGTGLGLSISYDIIVKSHSGSLQVESEEGSYTEFIIQLPLK